MDVVRAMAEKGLGSSASDAGVGALCARAAVRGAYLNVRTNCTDLDDEAQVKDYLERGRQLEEKAAALETDILALVDAKIDGAQS